MSSDIKKMQKPYADSGVNIQAGDEMAAWLAGQKENGSVQVFGEVVEGIGGFSALFRPKFSSLRDPLLVSSTDGVGTKLLLALEQDRLNGIGIDLVAMCVNDLYCSGATPLFFLDYFATGKLDRNQFKKVLGGIKAGLKECNTALIGGETAEMPGLYHGNHFDLAGFVVGVVDSSLRLGKHLVSEGDRLFSIASSGFHSNGFSLLRKWIEGKKLSEDLMSKLIYPTKIYSFLPDVLGKLPKGSVHALANITGGGLSGNLSRVIPHDLTAVIQKKKLKTPEWMLALFRDNGFHNPMDLEEVFNLGVGMIASVGAKQGDSFKAEIEAFWPCEEIGIVVKHGYKSKNAVLFE